MELLETCALISWIVIAICMLYLTLSEIFRKIKDRVDDKRQKKLDQEHELFDLKFEIDLLKDKFKESKYHKGL